MIVTAKNRIPFLWQLGIAAPWGMLRFKYMIMGGVFIFSLKKFIENPAGITFIMSVPMILSLAVNPICSFMSDRIWTRFGRRKPFVVPSMIGVVAAFVAMPLMPNIWGLLGAFFLYQIAHDFGLGATDTIKQEVVPPKQRGTAAAIGIWLQNISNLAFYLIAIGRFDDYQYYAGFPITGEESIYWGISAAIFMMALLMMLGVKETMQPSKLTGQRFTLRNFFGGLLDNRLWPVYLLITGWSVANAGLGALGALLYTEQWGFSKQEMGINIAVGSTLNIFLIALIGLFADKLPRMKSFELLLFLSIFIELSFYCYVNFILFDKTPSLPEVILFGEMASVAGIILGMLYTPLVYDYVPRNEMGTFSAGSVLVGKIVQIITINGVGIFVTVFSSFFMPPGGDMARVALDERTSPAEVRQLLGAHDPLLGDEDQVSVETWYATNAAFKTSHAFEIRRKSESSLDIKDEIDDINAKLSSLLAKKSNAEAKAERERIAGNSAAATAADAEIADFAEQAAPLEAEIASLEARLQSEADAFLSEVRTALQGSLMAEGSEVVAVAAAPATLFQFPLTDRPDSRDVANTLNHLRSIHSDLIDLRIGNRGVEFYLEASVRGERRDPSFARQLADDLERLGRPRIAAALGDLSATPAPAVRDSLQLELKTIEDPTNNYISPVTKVIYAIWNQFGDAPTPQRRILATARALRDRETSIHVGAWDTSTPDQHRIRIQAIYATLPEAAATTVDADDAGAAPAASAALTRLTGLLGTDHPQLPAAYDLFTRSRDAAAQNKITIPGPVLVSSFAPPKYDYMSGYLWMVIMSSIGLTICLLFTRRERKGLISKRGREESEDEARAELAAEEQRIASGGEAVAHTYYTPGYVPHKIVMTAFGVLLIVLGLIQLGPNLKLVLSGTPATAVASKVAKERVGGSTITLASDAEIKSAGERYDRSYIFWNYFQFEDAAGDMHEFRAPIGKQLSPQYSLLDADGLPTTLRIYYDPDEPSRYVIPFNYSTWFLSGMLVLFGCIGTYFGIVLLYYARKPIEMPILVPKSAPGDA